MRRIGKDTERFAVEDRIARHHRVGWNDRRWGGSKVDRQIDHKRAGLSGWREQTGKDRCG